jgi:hypothetical protein
MKQTLFGIGSCVFPLIVIVILVAVMIVMPNIESDSEIPEISPPLAITMLILSLLATGGIWFFIIYDIIHVSKNVHIDTRKKILELLLNKRSLYI